MNKTIHTRDAVEKVTITIETGNADFAGDVAAGLERALHKLSIHFSHSSAYGTEWPTIVRDGNGNTVGTVEVTHEREGIDA